MANRLRRHSLLSTTEAGSGHPSTCFSCAEIMSSLFFHFLRYDLGDPRNPANDRFVLSKGHGAPILWAALAEAGAFPTEELLTLRKMGSELEGHPTPRNRFIDVASGSLGQGLSNAVGMALSARMNGIENRIFTLLGDGESAEGSVYEAAALASHYKLANLTAILDINRLGQSEPTMYQHDLSVYENRFRSFGWNTITVDGHDVRAVVAALATAIADDSGPVALIASTIKGKGVSFMADKEGWHGKPVTDPEQVKKALEDLGPDEPLPEPLELAKPESGAVEGKTAAGEVPAPEFQIGEQVATRQAYGSGLAKLGRVHSEVVALDGDCKNSTYSIEFLKEHPDRFVECFIAEQNMVGTATGLAAMGKVPFASTFACFLTRAYDIIRMAAISQVNLKLCGSHAGVSIGEDGPSQMGLEDLAMMRAVAGSTVLYPSDGVSAEKLVAEAAATPGIVYIRTSRPKTPVIYPNSETFPVGGCKILRRSTADKATLVAAGVTLHEALKAYQILAEQNLMVRVIDLYSVKPVDQETLNEAALETGHIITVEDHYLEGGLGEAVRIAVDGVTPCRWAHLAVKELSRSGGSDELLDYHGLSARRIVEAVQRSLT
jgi:transketolase